ncbi:MAG: DUF1800 domain-containing protein [Saprospiraceae bacterium]
MQRSAFLQRSIPEPSFEIPPPPRQGIQPYTGTWTIQQAGHLLRRTLFGASPQQIQESVSLGMESTLDKLLEDLPLPAPPVNFNNPDDAFAPVGTTWVDKPYSPQTKANEEARYRRQSLISWTMQLAFAPQINIREKMWLFWHNHFVVSDINDPKYNYRYAQLLRTYATGNFRDLTYEITIDPAMLRYLNGNENTVEAPNENYARELLELFTIGKGPQVGSGDYTNYTEDDVVAIARVLTGWRDLGFFTQQEINVTSVFRPNRHDQGAKTLSHRFDQITIANQGAEEYKTLIDVIFSKKETARFLCRNLYQFLVYYLIDDFVEENIINPLAEILVENDYEVKPVLRALLQSSHFYDEELYGAMIKNPMDFVGSTVRNFDRPSPQDTSQNYLYHLILNRAVDAMDMQLFNAPDVAGWKAYYQEPSFYQNWINSTTLRNRQDWINIITGRKGGLNLTPYLLDPIFLLETSSDPGDIYTLLNEWIGWLLPQAITDGQFTTLKETLLPGLPDYEWKLEYGEYVSNPTDPDVKEAISRKLLELIYTLLNMPEYYLA